MDPTLFNFILTLTILFILSRIRKLYNGIRATGNLSGYRIPLAPYAFPGGALGTWWCNLGTLGVWHKRKTLYKSSKCDIISVVPFLSGQPAIFVANWDIAKKISGFYGKSAFAKMSVESNGPASFFGANVGIAEGEEWRRHRRVVSPAFNQKLYELAWSESLSLYKEMLSSEGLDTKKQFDLPAVQDLIFKYTFYIIGRCGFDFPFSWGDQNHKADAEESGSGTAFVEAIRFLVEHIGILNLSQRGIDLMPLHSFRTMSSSLKTIRKFMDDKIKQKESDVKLEAMARNDIFSKLVQANLAEGNSKMKLDYKDVISDIFLLLFAGHETTSHTLSATIACLAMYQDQQQELVDQIVSVIGPDSDPTFEHLPKLNKVAAAFYEGLRMFPTTYLLMRQAMEDTVLHVPMSDKDDSLTAVPIKKGTQIMIDMIGIHRNPRHFDDPEQYRASRWYDVSNDASNDFIAGFGIGPRACIGRKFALSEAMCFLTMLLRDWKIEPLLREGETREEWFEDVAKCHGYLSLGVNKVRVRFTRR